MIKKTQTGETTWQTSNARGKLIAFIVLGGLAGAFLFVFFMGVIYVRYSAIVVDEIAATLQEQPVSRPRQTISTNGLPLLANVQRTLQETQRLTRINGIEEPEISAQAALIYEPVRQQTLFEHNAAAPRPTASIAKLMTAIVVLDSYEQDGVVTISEAAYNTYGDIAGLLQGERLLVRDLLEALLIPSSNDAAVALAEQIGVDRFVDLMNRKASQFGMIGTSFVEPSGLSSDNVSTAWDLARLLRVVQMRDVIWDVLEKETSVIYGLDGHAHPLETTNKILSDKEILAAKTGYIAESGENYAAFVRSPADTTLIMIILGSDDRFADARALIDWLSRAYQWSDAE